MAILPMLGIMAGRWWPFLFPLPIVALPIAGKTVRELSINTESIPLLAGLCVYLLMPLYIIGAVAILVVCYPSIIGLRLLGLLPDNSDPSILLLLCTTL